jgi:hypothetical protein
VCCIALIPASTFLGVAKARMRCCVFFFLCTLVFFAATASPSTPQDTVKDTWITIFVHGIMSIKHHVSFENFMRFMQDDIEDCLYTKTINIMRTNPFFFQNQAMQLPGLHSVSIEGTQPNGASTAALLFNHLEAGYADHYYTFGWSGLLSARARYQDGQCFLKELTAEVSTLQERGIHPKIRIIAYSHGCNVSLNLAAALQHLPTRPNFVIDELILVGVPIQQETDYLINSPFFKSIYNLYSPADRVQRLDIFSPQSFLSKRVFKARPGFTLPDKLKQIELRITRCNARINRSLANKEMIHDLKKYGMLSGKSRFLRTMHPGHAELWFFGWSSIYYRKNFPLYPLPSIVAIPFITQYCKTHTVHCAQKPRIFDVRPDFEKIIIRDKRTYETIPFLSQEKLRSLKDLVLANAPTKTKDQFHKLQQQHIRTALAHALALQTAQDLKKTVRSSNKKRRRWQQCLLK